MTSQNVAFWILAIAMGTGAVGVVRSRNIVHAALFLIVVLVGAAAQYIVLLAEFVGITQFFIYIGAIAVLFLFGIMLTRAPMRSADLPCTKASKNRSSRVATARRSSIVSTTAAEYRSGPADLRLIRQR